MLHRLALRVLPSLTLAVTEDAVRKRKRWVMLVPGVIAFAAYRLLKLVAPLSEPLVLLGASGLVSAGIALWAYRVGRDRTWAAIRQEDGPGRLLWLVGWIGFVYAVQLSLLVLALLKIALNYDFLQHPDGPAMMAMIIAATSVARDAFEIGHVRALQSACDEQRPILTFPDGAALRQLIVERPGPVLLWALCAAAIGAVVDFTMTSVGAGSDDLAPLVTVMLLAGTLSLLAYLAADPRGSAWPARLAGVGGRELFRFWWWPGLAFAATYYLVLVGTVAYVLRIETPTSGARIAMAAGVAALMAAYGYYLGARRHAEDRIRTVVPASLLRCPFVLGMLSKGKTGGMMAVDPRGLAPRGIIASESGRHGS